MNGFLDIENVRVPSEAAEEANEFLRYAGLRRSEGFALWVGRREGAIFQVKETIIPTQTGYVGDEGVCVTVEGDELHRLNVLLYRQKMQIIAQLHSHPGSAYHSDTDDTFPIATIAGSLSLVIPDFARFPFSLARCAIYRLTQGGKWEFMPSRQAVTLITIV